MRPDGRMSQPASGGRDTLRVNEPLRGGSGGRGVRPDGRMSRYAEEGEEGTRCA